MNDLKDFVKAFAVLAQNSTGGRVHLRYLKGFEQYESFDDVPDNALNALQKNLETVPAEGQTLEMRDQLVAILHDLQRERFEKRRSEDDEMLPPLERRSYDSQESFVERVVSVHPHIPEDFAAMLFSWDFERGSGLTQGDLITADYREELWSTAEVLERVTHDDPQGFSIEVSKFTGQQDYRDDYAPAAHMVTHGTWLTCLPVLRRQGNDREIKLLGPIHPLAFLHAMVEMGRVIAESHRICIVTSSG